MKEFFGYAGKVLRIDLTSEKITEEHLDEETARKYLGGTGLGAKYLYEEVPAGVNWSDSNNRLILASGPLGTSPIGGSGTISVVTKGALTDGAASSQANGFFGAYLKFSGYDGIIFQGKAKRWVYLYIDGNGKTELRDASHLAGKDTWETCDIIKAEFGKKEREMSVACIGPAGENLVKFAAIFVDKSHSASHNGVGAVMGSKRLKAIAVERGKGLIEFKDKEKLKAISNQLHQNILDDPVEREGHYRWGTLYGVTGYVTGKSGILPVKNYTTTNYDITPENLEKYSAPYIRGHFEPKPEPCWACRMHHCHTLTLTEGQYKGLTVDEPEYESFAAFGPVIGVTDVTATIMLANEADHMGIDSNETGWTLGLVMECFGKGIINKQDCNGLEMKWGDFEAAKELIHAIATREGFGNVLAEGAMRAARKIGGETPQFAIHTMKGNTPRGHDHRSRWAMLFDTCVSQMGTDEGYTVLNAMDLGYQSKPAYSKTSTSAENTLLWNVLYKGAAQFEDCLGLCRFTTRTDLKLLAQAVSAATSWDFPIEETMQVGKRVVNLLRVFNMRHGHTPEMDAPSPRYGSAPADGPSQGIRILDNWSNLRNDYYEKMGWDKATGKPLPETLKNLGLEYTVADLWGK